METLSIKVPKELKARLKATARLRMTRPSSLLRQALENVLEQPSSGVSLYDQSKDILDVEDKSGPRDLSTHPKHLKNYGR